MKKGNKKSKNPYLAALLNGIIPGIGYLYIGKRREFSILLLIGCIPSFIWGWTSDPNTPIFSNVWEVLTTILIMSAFAVDAYIQAKE